MNDIGYLAVAYLAVWAGLLAATGQLLWRARQALRVVRLQSEVSEARTSLEPPPPPAWLQRSLVAVISLVLLLQLLILFAVPLVDPAAHSAPYSQKLFYLHVPLAAASYLLFTLVFIYSLAYLRTRNLEYELRSRAAANLGVWCAGLALLTGSLWAAAEWGYYWRAADLKLTVYLVLFLVYLALMVLRVNSDETEATARFAAIYGVVAFPVVPLSALSARFNRASLHGTPAEVSLSPAAAALFAFAMAVILALIWLLYRLAAHVELAHERVCEVQSDLESAVTGVES